MKICPYCHQDAVWHVQLKTVPAHHFSMCFECDSVWLAGQPVSDQTGTTFDQYMHLLGHVPNWKEIEKIKMVD
jgi:Zn-finger nucleic acid-binding protein